jgi:hypothetical protein
MDLYQIVSWLGWIPNLLLIELYIFKQKNKWKIPFFSYFY